MSIYSEEHENYRVYKDFVLTRKNPYGFWVISAKSGKTPDAFAKDMFTNLDMARNVIDAYLSKNLRPTKK